VKYYAWETAFEELVAKMRAEEITILTRIAYTIAIGMSLILMSAPVIQPVLIFAVYTSAMGKSLDAATAFTTIALFNLLRFPFAVMPMGFLQYMNCQVASNRISRFLDKQTLVPYLIDVSPSSSPSSPSSSSNQSETKSVSDLLRMDRSLVYAVEKAAFGWGVVEDSTSSISPSLSTEPVACLTDLSFNIKKGSLVVVIGPVGSGKTSLLNALTGEMECLAGSMARRKGLSIAVAAQVPWIINKSLFENVIFGHKYDESRYKQVVSACRLTSDLEVLPGGDQCEIGEKGINLSGGQKARVALARAVYSDSDVLLMDDPLSAVDAHVGEALFKECIQGPLLESKTRILVTHHIHFLERCDVVMVMDKGSIVAHGTYDELKTKHNITALLAKDKEESIVENKVEDKVEDKDQRNGLEEEVQIKTKETETQPIKSIKDQQIPTTTTSTNTSKLQPSHDGQLMVKEDVSVGAVTLRAYKYYAENGGWFLVLGVLICSILGRTAEVLSSFWLVIWASQSLKYENNHKDGESGLPEDRTSYFLTIYACLSIAGVVGLVSRALFIATHRIEASQTLHENLVKSVLRAPVAFFDTTPMGRIINRFAADIQTVDVEMSQTLNQITASSIAVLGALIAIAIATSGTFLLVAIPCTLIYLEIQKLFRQTSTEVTRYSKLTRSPIFADFSMALAGASSIRAYKCSNVFLSSAMHKMDENNAHMMMIQLCFSWLTIRLDAIGAVVFCFIVAIAVATKDFISAGWLGLALSFAVELTSFMKQFVRFLAQLEGQMASVERIMEYTDEIEAEEPAFLKTDRMNELKLKSDKRLKAIKSMKNTSTSTSEVQLQESLPVPSQGVGVVFDNVVMGYREGPDVLKGLSFEVKGGEKIGIVGRTGSGKSSFMVALFRFNELRQGRILVGEEDITSTRLAQHRGSLSIIPQDPVLFSASIRFNLDPFHQFSDAVIYQVLEKVSLLHVVNELPHKINEMVSEGGENFSVGQRQLICIGRALLRSPKVLMLDEATASIDNETDSKIQDMIRTEFKTCTVLTIAHRLHTIMDSDRVLVLEDGIVLEFDSPENLLNENSSEKDNEQGVLGAFKGLVDAANKSGSITKVGVVCEDSPSQHELDSQNQTPLGKKI